MRTPGLNHIILTVSDVTRSRAFYGDLLGFEIIVIEEDPDKSFFFTVGVFKSLYFLHAGPSLAIVLASFALASITSPLARPTTRRCMNLLTS
jgi:catechol 2,3-dioxygenase-like lactoylglutathione lyase family enzyme